MAMPPITPLERVPPTAVSCTEADGPQAGSPFERVLGQVLGGVGATDSKAGQAVQELATGEADDLHTAALAIAQSDLSFRLALAVRNRLLEAYQEIIRMQV